MVRVIIFNLHSKFKISPSNGTVFCVRIFLYFNVNTQSVLHKSSNFTATIHWKPILKYLPRVSECTTNQETFIPVAHREMSRINHVTSNAASWCQSSLYHRRLNWLPHLQNTSQSKDISSDQNGAMKTLASRWCKYLQTEKHLISKTWGPHSSVDKGISLLGCYTASTDKFTMWQDSNKNWNKIKIWTSTTGS